MVISSKRPAARGARCPWTLPLRNGSAASDRYWRGRGRARRRSEKEERDAWCAIAGERAITVHSPRDEKRCRAGAGDRRYGMRQHRTPAAARAEGIVGAMGRGGGVRDDEPLLDAIRGALR